MSEDNEGKSPSLFVVSDNPNARVDRKLGHARQEVERTVTLFAASLLRTMAGSETEAMFLMSRLSDFLDALHKFCREAGRELTSAELEKFLRLPDTEYELSNDEWLHREWLRNDGLEKIVKGALRLAAHRILDERPHFGGKYSKDVIEEGIKTLDELKRPLAAMPSFRHKMPSSRHKEAATGDTSARIDLGPYSKMTAAEKAGGRKKRTVGFSAEDLKELRKAIRAKDEKKITELRAKLGKSLIGN